MGQTTTTRTGETSTVLLRLSLRTAEVLVSYSRWVNQSHELLGHLQDLVQGWWILAWDYESQDFKSRWDFRSSQILAEGFSLHLSPDNDSWLQITGVENQPSSQHLLVLIQWSVIPASTGWDADIWDGTDGLFSVQVTHC